MDGKTAPVDLNYYLDTIIVRTTFYQIILETNQNTEVKINNIKNRLTDIFPTPAEVGMEL